MREIICRGKDLDNEWRIGYLGVFKGKVRIFVPFTAEEEKENEGHFLSAIGGLWYNIKPETVGQYTGLTDKNCKKIFEGDIVKDDPRETEVVKYEGGGFAPFAIPNWECTPDAEWVEVIGNIHDNPELIGGDVE